MCKERMQIAFYESLRKIPIKSNSVHLSLEKYANLMNEVKVAKGTTKNKKNRDYWLLKHYDVVTENAVDKLVAPMVSGKFLYYAYVEELFEILYNSHIAINHGGRDRMKKELQQHYKNITAKDVQLFINVCESCSKKRTREKKNLLAKMLSNIESRGQVDLLDFQSQADGEFKFILVYHELPTKFVILRALKSNQTLAVAEQLLDIFLLFGAPSILQSDSGQEFVNQIIDDLKRLWMEVKIVSGKSCDTQLQGSVVNTNQEIEIMVNMWMLQEQSSNWGIGLGFVQFSKNRTLHPESKLTPHEAMFGGPAKCGLAASISTDLENSLQHTQVQDDSEEETSESTVKDGPISSGNLTIGQNPACLMDPNVDSHSGENPSIKMAMCTSTPLIVGICNENLRVDTSNCADLHSSSAIKTETIDDDVMRENGPRDVDDAYLLSLKPDYMWLTQEQKFDFKIHVLQFFKTAYRENYG